MPALSSSWTSSFLFSPWCLLLPCIYRQQFTSPLHFHYAGINMEAVLIPWCNQTAPSLCSPWLHFLSAPKVTTILQRKPHCYKKWPFFQFIVNTRLGSHLPHHSEFWRKSLRLWEAHLLFYHVEVMDFWQKYLPWTPLFSQYKNQVRNLNPKF